MKTAMASLMITATLAVCCWGQEPAGETEAQLSRAQLEATVREARQAALEAREAAQAAQRALEEARATSTAAEHETPHERHWRRARRSSGNRQARLEAQRWRGEFAARPTVYVNLFQYGGLPSAPPDAWVASPYAPSVVVPIYRARAYYPWYSN